MRPARFAILALSLTLTAPMLAQTNTDATTQTKSQLKQQARADKSQAKADKAERKALKTKEQKKADKAQDKADREMDKAATPSQ
jgi:hypothetical protein